MSKNIQVLEFEKPMVEIERKLEALREDGKSSKTATGKKKIAEIDSEFACTGDISADGNVQKIGGVGAKVRGAARKGCELVAIPVGNSD